MAIVSVMNELIVTVLAGFSRKKSTASLLQRTTKNEAVYESEKVEYITRPLI